MTSGSPAATGGRPSGRRLRLGFSTGTAAAAAAKAALTVMLTSHAPASVSVELPGGERLELPVARASRVDRERAAASVIKDAGDDPDVTNGAEIRVRVALLGHGRKGPAVRFRGGEGVGTVTRPGLAVAVGEPAINPVPRRMIKKALAEAWAAHGGGRGEMRLEVEISVPRGQELARRTFNPRLGIVGGISIIGTHGLVKPFSHEGYTGTIDSALSVARAQGLREVVLTTGGKSEKLARGLRPELPEQAFIQIADFFAHALARAVKMDMHTLGLVCFFGKAVKQAMGLAYTHARRAPLDQERLAGWLARAGAGPELHERIARANTARHALEILQEQGRLELVGEVGRRMLASARSFAGPGPGLWGMILDFSGRVLFSGRAEDSS